MKKFLFQKVAMLIIAVSLSVPFASNAQDKVELSASADLVSKYVWRGANQGQGAAFQPMLGLSYKGLSLSAWGSTGISNYDAYEVDFTLGYSIGPITLALTDYYWDGHSTGYGYWKDAHHLEASAGLSIGEKFSLSLATMIGGYDPSLKKDAKDGDRNFSSYVNAGYNFTIGDATLNASIGVTPWGSSLWGKYLNDGKSNGFEIADISFKGSKSLKITESFSLPIFSQLIFSPATDSAHLVFGISF
ncbi:MAG: hypothetical protein LBD53_00555 [Tannerella sp.]|nr:hypothetical protein [Tannerella sp.]